MSEDTIPGTLYRLTVFEADGMVAEGYPKIYSTISRFRAAIKAQERNGHEGRTWIKEGCARGPWLSLEGPVIPSEESMYWTFRKELADEVLEA
jgi:hypothetical protein